MSVFDLFRGFFGVPGGRYRGDGRRDPFFDIMTHDDDDDDDDEDGQDFFFGGCDGGHQEPFDEATRFGFSFGPSGLRVQEPQIFGDVFREMEELFGPTRPVGTSARFWKLWCPQYRVSSERCWTGRPSRAPPSGSPVPHRSPFSKFSDIWRGGLRRGAEEDVVREDRDMDSRVSSEGLDQILTPAPAQPKFRSFFQSVTVTKVVKPDGSVEERRTVRDGQGNEETTVTRSGPRDDRGPQDLTGPPGPKTRAPSSPSTSDEDLRAEESLGGRRSLSGKQDAGMDSVFRRVRLRSRLLRECLAECLGVYVIIVFGCGTVAQVTTSENSKGHYLSINLGFALGTTFGVYVSRGVSGAHLNPAVTLSLCMLGRHPWRKLPFYVFCQVFGGFLGAATVALQYYDAIMHFSNGQLTVTGPTATAGIFATYPADYLSLWGGFVDQVIGTAMLLVCILCVGDCRNTAVSPELAPVLVGLVVLAIGMSMGVNCGYALNPARDFGPRLYSYLAGWGDQVFWAGGGWWWVPLVAPCVGAIVGSVAYELLIEAHHPDLGLDPEKAAQCQTVENKLALELEGVQLDLNAPKGCPNEGQEGGKAVRGTSGGEEG
ncbi:hypothetical protein SKAU_G00407740 [Synaphobranchus kaupii]|uniref:Uncharacterized protein n=1 Tax=Synaphobranchus kaupii TaxID=118154 RepID=A0A9Q1EAD7_SYNKA|nr:hypothetical protein SKAU_G00407740 [Synaphobranchus kaupii]